MSGQSNRGSLNEWLVATVSHDLRSPLSSVVGVLQLLKDERSRMPTDQQWDFLDDLLTNSRKQLWLMDNMSCWAKWMRKTLQPEYRPHSSTRLVSLTSSQLSHLSPESSIDLGIGQDWVIETDESLFVLLLGDLILASNDPSLSTMVPVLDSRPHSLGLTLAPRDFEESFKILDCHFDTSTLATRVPGPVNDPEFLLDSAALLAHACGLVLETSCPDPSCLRIQISKPGQPYK